MPLKFKVDIQSQSRVRKPKNPIWPPGGHFESDVAKNQYVPAYGHHQLAYEIWNWNYKGNLTYAPETMSSTNRRTDRRMDGWTRWIQYTPPPTSLGGGIKILIVLNMYKENPRNFLQTTLSSFHPLCMWGRPTKCFEFLQTYVMNCLTTFKNSTINIAQVFQQGLKPKGFIIAVLASEKPVSRLCLWSWLIFLPGVLLPTWINFNQNMSK